MYRLTVPYSSSVILPSMLLRCSSFFSFCVFFFLTQTCATIFFFCRKCVKVQTQFFVLFCALFSTKMKLGRQLRDGRTAPFNFQHRNKPSAVFGGVDGRWTADALGCAKASGLFRVSDQTRRQGDQEGTGRAKKRKKCSPPASNSRFRQGRRKEGEEKKCLGRNERTMDFRSMRARAELNRTE